MRSFRVTLALLLCIALPACGQGGAKPDLKGTPSSDNAAAGLRGGEPQEAGGDADAALSSSGTVDGVLIQEGDRRPIDGVTPAPSIAGVVIGGIEVSEPRPIDWTTPAPPDPSALTGMARASFRAMEGMEEELLLTLTDAYAMYDIDAGGYRFDIVTRKYVGGALVSGEAPYLPGDVGGMWESGPYLCAVRLTRLYDSGAATLMTDVYLGVPGRWGQGGAGDTFDADSAGHLKWEYGPEDFVHGAELPLLCVYFFNGPSSARPSTLEEAVANPGALAFFLRVW